VEHHSLTLQVTWDANGRLVGAGLGMMVWQDMPSMCGMMPDSWGRNWYKQCMTSERDIPDTGRSAPAQHQRLCKVQDDLNNRDLGSRGVKHLGLNSQFPKKLHETESGRGMIYWQYAANSAANSK